ncbi:sensor histidine kinase [Cohnella thermotolerans]|uniref:sensor histidine kinase n=1 Tax=Cohnella thermotolerans TaxID=329858 RepID=UPI000426F418|nr:sensor histidine kinase [Cohnella thermotolerans]
MRRPFRLFGIINDISLNYKFTLIYLLCVLLPIITINVLFYEQVSKSVQAREERNLQTSMDRAVKTVYDIIIGGVTLSHSISSDRTFYEPLDKDYADSVDFYETYNAGLKSKMVPFLSAYTSVDTIGIYTNNDTIESGGNYFRLEEQDEKTGWYLRTLSNPGKITLYVYRDKEPLNSRSQKTYFSILRTMNDFSIYGKYLKILKIDLNTSRLSELMNQGRPDLNLKLVDPDGRIIFSSSQEEDTRNPDFVRFDGGEAEKDMLLLEEPLGEDEYLAGWKLVGTTDKSQISEAVLKSRKFIWQLGIVSTFVPTALIVVILRSYNQRIKRLLRHMTKVKNGKFDLIASPEGKDEIGGLIHNFNLMTAKIHSLIHDVYELELQKKDLELERVRAEMNLLQSQMNPHFLFNTLNALLVVSAKNKYADVAEIIRNLSLLLRRMINWSEDLVPLREELHFTEMYLQIEKFRFADRFDYAIEAEEEAKQVPVPKMCVQTLVENACKHGLQAVKGQRGIRVGARLSSAYLIVEVQDNGIGMSPEQLDAITEQMREKRGDGASIGLRNVYQRLRLYYDDRVDFRIESLPDVGTKAVFRIPLKSDSQEKGAV